MTVPTCDTRSGCITCGDEGIPMRVLEVAGDGAVCVDEAGTHHEVAIDLVGAVALGERVLVHAGVAIGTVA
ncbi:MAG TPA: HypC/HybG/HupF family hydrogenase formation chaperone [Solirubrobacteraceae bacterium]|nr:HypC/HybG/HupF family hydrogenase formation chaperone [Solirubrobacteraceae bacterium]